MFMIFERHRDLWFQCHDLRYEEFSTKEEAFARLEEYLNDEQEDHKNFQVFQCHGGF